MRTQRRADMGIDNDYAYPCLDPDGGDDCLLVKRDEGPAELILDPQDIALVLTPASWGPKRVQVG